MKAEKDLAQQTIAESGFGLLDQTLWMRREPYLRELASHDLHHPNCAYSAACLIAWTIGGNLVTEPKGKGYISYIQERQHVPDHQAQAKVIHTAHVHPAHEGLD